MTIRISDAYKPGYNRVPLGETQKTQPPSGVGKVGSPILNQAQAAILGQASIAAADPVGSRTARYWRFEFPDTTYNVIYELQLFAADGVNYAAAEHGGSATADSFIAAGNEPWRAINLAEDDNNKWASAPTAAMTHWLEIALDTPRTIISARLVPRSYVDGNVHWTQRSVVIKTGDAPAPTLTLKTLVAGTDYPNLTVSPVTTTFP